MYILNLVYNIVIYNEFSHCLLYTSSHSSLLLGRVCNIYCVQEIMLSADNIAIRGFVMCVSVHSAGTFLAVTGPYLLTVLNNEADC